jgi:hypothetical protein
MQASEQAVVVDRSFGQIEIWNVVCGSLWNFPHAIVDA